MLAMSDKYGEVSASVPGLARRAGITVEQTEDGIARFLGPDTYSRTPDFEGRRIAVMESRGGWVLLNHAKYRDLMSVEERKEYNRLKQAERRARLNRVKVISDVSKRQTLSMTVNDSQQCQHIQRQRAEEDTYTEATGITPLLPPQQKRHDLLPTTDAAIRISRLFGRRLTTAWGEKEVKAFKKLAIQPGDLEAIEVYYAVERGKGDDGIHRRDLATFLNNFGGELDRAMAHSSKNGAENWEKEWE